MEPQAWQGIRWWGEFFNQLVDTWLPAASLKKTVEMIGLRDVLISRAATPLVAGKTYSPLLTKKG